MPKSINDITADYLRERLDYDPETGIFTWREHPDLNMKFKFHLVGKQAGGSRPDGRVKIRINGRDYLGSRLAWLYVTGEWPTVAEHRHGNRGSTKITDLRDATQQQNLQNRRRMQNVSGYKGVRNNHGKWQAYITLNYKFTSLGNYATPELAHEAYCRAATEHFGEFANFG